VLNLPPAAQAAINVSKHTFITTDRGHIRLGNDGSFDSRSQFFASWLARKGFNQQSAANMSDEQKLKILGTFLHDLCHGDNLLCEKILVDQTLHNYVASAANFFTILTRRRCITHNATTTMHQAKPALHPYSRSS
jgi:hypothetical protein